MFSVCHVKETTWLIDNQLRPRGIKGKSEPRLGSVELWRDGRADVYPATDVRV